MNSINIINEINKHLNVYEIAQMIENTINNYDYNFEVVNNDLVVSDNDVTITMLSNEFLKTQDLNDIIYHVKVAILNNEIKVRYDNYCLDDEQVDAMLNIVTSSNY